MSSACPNCGNTQHAPGASTCCVCGQSISSEAEDAWYLSETTRNGSLCAQDRRTGALSSNPGLVDQYGNHYPIDLKEDTIIGSDPSADICIRSSNIRQQHARLYLNGGQVLIEALFGSLVFVNGRAMDREPRTLLDRQVITFGDDFALQYRSNLPRMTTAQNTNLVPREVPKAEVIRRDPSPRTHSTPSECDLYGRVRHIEGPYMEEPDPTLATKLIGIAKVGLAIWKPWTLVLHKQPKQVQVRLIRVEIGSDNVRAVKMKGNPISGMISSGDHVQFWGEWKDGTLLMHRAYNETLKSYVYIMQ